LRNNFNYLRMALNIDELTATLTPDKVIEKMRQYRADIPTWEHLEKEYNPLKHPVFTDTSYTDIYDDNGIERVTRVAEGLQRLAVERMIGLTFGIPVKRIYSPEDDNQQLVADYIENILQRNKINTINIDRARMLLAGCEVGTMWFAVPYENSLYGFPSKIKLKCRNYSQMKGDVIYPVFDEETDDMVALCFGYSQTIDSKTTQYFDIYTADKHIRYIRQQGEEWKLSDKNDYLVGKIPAVYASRPTPIWEYLSQTVYEREWALSRNGNYLRNNSRPTFAVFSDKLIGYNKSPNGQNIAKDVLQFPQGSDARYISWDQAIENLKFYTEELKKTFYSQLQLPDTSFESMKATPMSAESRKMLFVDSILKVRQESGRFIELFDREINVIKAYLKLMRPQLKQSIDALVVENEITPFQITDEKETISNLIAATAGKAIASQREAIKYLGWSDNVDETMQQIAEENSSDAFEPTV